MKHRVKHNIILIGMILAVLSSAVVFATNRYLTDIESKNNKLTIILAKSKLQEKQLKASNEQINILKKQLKLAKRTNQELLLTITQNNKSAELDNSNAPDEKTDPWVYPENVTAKNILNMRAHDTNSNTRDNDEPVFSLSNMDESTVQFTFSNIEKQFWQSTEYADLESQAEIEKEFKAAIHDRNLRQVSLDSVKCNSSLCRIEFLLTDLASEKFLNRLSGIKPLLNQHIIKTTTEVNDQNRVLIYLVQTGHYLPLTSTN